MEDSEQESEESEPETVQPVQQTEAETEEEQAEELPQETGTPRSKGETFPEDDLLPCYPSFDELGELIEQSALEAQTFAVATTVQELEALLEQEPQTEAETVAAEVEKDAEREADSEGEASQGGDDEFADVLQLLQQAQQQAGEIPTDSAQQRPQKAPRRTSRPKVEATLKVPVRQMDNLSNLVGELVVNRNSLEGDEERLRQFLDNLMHQVQSLSDVGGRMQDLYERSLLENALLRSRKEYRSQRTGEYAPASATTDADQSNFDELEMDSFTKFHELAQETIELIVRVRESTSDIQFLVDDIDQVARTLRQVTSQLQEGLTKARMIPFGNTANRLPLAVRRIAPQLNKQVNLSLEGQDTLVDKMILEHLSDPLTHLVNNGLTHGIEAPEVRLAAGKPQAGRIKVSALQQGNQTVISVSDDGAGIEPSRVKNKAVQKGLIRKDQAKNLSNMEVYDLLFHPGFSTKDTADGFSGRGVGLDVVRTSINEIRGNVTIDSKLGQGTTFTIRLPLTLSICKALCCVSENAPIAFPLDGVEDMFDLPKQKLQRNAQGQLCVPWHDTLLPHTELSELLSYNRRLGRGNLYGGKREENVISIVILRGAGNHVAVSVDRVVGEQEIVIKQLQGPIPKPPGIAGATVQGDGKIMAIADVLELIEISQGRIRKDMASPLWQAPTSFSDVEDSKIRTESIVLIVDDSITVRELLSMTFSKAGYRVEQARDGQDAWDKLRSGMPCDIVFCDIEMPRVDGLDFLGRLQKDEELSKIPVAMLTSRGADRHRQVAAELGASGYFTKPYLEDVLLDAAERMLNGEVLLAGSTRPSRPQPKPQPEKPQKPAQPQAKAQKAQDTQKKKAQDTQKKKAQDTQKKKAQDTQKKKAPAPQAEKPPQAKAVETSGPMRQFEDDEFPTLIQMDDEEDLSTPSTTPTTPTQPPGPPEQPVVLIVDDSVTVRSLLSMTFENAGYEVEQARDGKDAFKQLQEGLRPDIALFDIEMPKMDGLELLGNLQQEDELWQIPVAMLTSRGADRHRKLAAERGASGYFTKPYVEQDLLEAVERIRNGEVLLNNSVRSEGITTWSDRTATPEEAAPESPDAPPEADYEPEDEPDEEEGDTEPTMIQTPQSRPQPEHPTVLIVDDSVTVRSLLSMTFEKAGYEVEQARDGKDALTKLKSGLNPSLAFLDIEMPKMDGLQLLTSMQEDEELQHIPVAMLTSRGAKKHKQMAAEKGAKGYFTKPYVEDVLLDAAERLMNGEVLLQVEA
ncbi:response regulator [Spirulina sp. CS-785/01]|uniref:hybrid sensor histidine kinase/response regulator n=1 Tax=Spirulina sp. CS-785/01 TaxID=3021716 RepID=UPI003FA6A3A2